MSRKKQKSASREAHNLHDGFFKKIFKNAKYLMQLFHIVLPPRFVAAFDADSLTIKDGILLKRSGVEIRTDLTAAMRLKNTDTEITITFILEHKSYCDPEVNLQTMEYYLSARREQRKLKSRKKGAARNLVIPVVLICCKDKDFEPPRDDLELEFGDEEIPPILEEHRHLFRQMPIITVNLRKLPLDNFWDEAGELESGKQALRSEAERESGKQALRSEAERESGANCRAAVTAVKGMADVWDATDDTIAELLTKCRLLPSEEGGFMLENLNEYYISADNAVDEGDFNRVDRERWPDLAQKERLETMLETQSDRAERRGIEKGIKLGKLDTARQLLLDGVDERIICKAAKLSKKELAEIKRSLDRD